MGPHADECQVGTGSGQAHRVESTGTASRLATVPFTGLMLGEVD